MKLEKARPVLPPLYELELEEVVSRLPHECRNGRTGELVLGFKGPLVRLVDLSIHDELLLRHQLV